MNLFGMAAKWNRTQPASLNSAQAGRTNGVLAHGGMQTAGDVGSPGAALQGCSLRKPAVCESQRGLECPPRVAPVFKKTRHKSARERSQRGRPPCTPPFHSRFHPRSRNRPGPRVRRAATTCFGTARFSKPRRCASSRSFSKPPGSKESSAASKRATVDPTVAPAAAQAGRREALRRLRNRSIRREGRLVAIPNLGKIRRKRVSQRRLPPPASPRALHPRELAPVVPPVPPARRPPPGRTAKAG